MKLAKNALIAVVDGEHLALFRNTADTGLRLTPANTPELDTSGGGSGDRTSSAGNPDSKTQSEDAFAAAVAERLNKIAITGNADEILVIAAPKTLGELRKHWHSQLKSRLVGEISKDLTGQSPERITAAIEAA
jgi:protein required for attachment to host cells